MKKRLFNQQSEPGSRVAATAQRLSVKAKIMMALFALMLIPQGAWAQYYLKIGNQEFSGDGTTSLSGLQDFTGIITGGSVVYDHSSHTLSLNGATISGNIVWNFGDNLNIELEGDNVLTGRIIANNSYTLTFIKSSASTGNCSLTISSGAVAAATSAISGFSDVWYKHVYLDSAYPVAYDGSQMKMLDYQYPNSPSDASSISLKSDHVYHRIWVNGTQLTDLTLTTLAPNLVYSGSPDSDDGGTRTLTLNNYTANGPIVSDLPNLTILLNGTNKLGDNGGYIKNIRKADVSVPLTIGTVTSGSASTLEIHNTTGNSAVEGFASVTLDGTYLCADNSCTYVGGTIKAYQYPETDTPYPLNVQDLIFTTTHYYPLWVGSQQVSEANNGIINFLGIGTASFEHSTSGENTLTLEGVSIDSSNGIESGLDNLTIALKGVNSINTNTAYHYYPIYSNVANASLTIKKDETATDCSLTLSSSSNSPQVVKGFKTVTYDGLAYDTTVGSGTTLDAIDTYGAKLSFTTYPLTVAGTPVTSANKGDVLNNGKVSYSHDATNNTYILKLNGATIAGGVVWSAGDDLIIELTGENSISNTSGDALLCTYTTSTPTVNFIAVGGTAVSSCKLTLTSGVGTYLPVNGFNINTALYDLGVIDNGTTKTRVISSSLFSGGDGTSNTPYLIATPEDLKNLAIYTNTGQLDTEGKYFNLVQDIDCTGLTGFEPIGTSARPFKGYMEGFIGNVRHTISNLTYTTSNTSADVGLFGVIDKDNFGVAHVDMQNCSFSGGARVGAEAGYLKSGIIWNCSIINSTISSGDASASHAGGLAGESSGWIANCYVGSSTITATVSKGTAVNAGGLVGYMSGGEMLSNLSDGNTVVSTSGTPVNAYAGAIVGCRSDGTFGVNSNNGNYACHYTYSGSVVTNVAGVTETKTGNMARGIGNSADIPNSAALADVFEITLSNDATKGTVSPKADTYYTYTDPFVYASRYTYVTIVVTPVDGYRPTLTLSDTNIAVTSTDVNNGSGNYSYTEFTFYMPSANVTATANYTTDISSNGFTASIDDATYSPTGSLTPTTVKLTSVGGGTITLSNTGNTTDFTITDIVDHSGNPVTEFTKADTYLVTIQGQGSYIGTRDISYTIIPKSATGLTVNVGGTYTYIGSSIVPADADIVVKDGSTTLVLNTDYTITSCTNNTNAATSNDASAPAVTITGMGNYDSSTTASGTFTIGQADLAGVTIDAIANQAFTGSAIQPSVSVTFNGTTVDPSEYNVNYTNNTNVGTATVTLTSTNKNFSTVHSKDANFEIVQTTASITAKDQTVIYNGTPQAIPGVSVDYGTVVITYYKSAADRTANTGGTTTAPTNAATYYVKVTQGDAGYTSVPAEVTFTISPKSANGLTVNVGGTYTYTGSAIEPADADIVVKDGSTTLVLNTDYTITSCTNNTNAATSNDASAPTVTITGMGNYDSSTTASGTFTIGKADFAGVTIDAIANQAFTGSALMPPVSVKFNGTTVNPSEYNVSYTNNTNVGTATVRLTSTNKNFSTVNYKDANFTIAAASATITATNQTVTYNGIPQVIPGVSVDNGTVVITYYKSAADRTANTGGTTTAPTNAATYYVRVTQGDASYTSVPVDVTFTISPKSANGLTVTVGGPYTYTGSAIEPALSVTDGRTPLTAGTDYTVSYTSNVNVGMATATVTCIGNYTGSIPKTFSIIPKSIKGVSVTIDGTYTYTGAAIVPADADITVTDGNMALDKDKDYTLSVTNNTNAGTATVTVTGKGNYDSATSETGSFTIDQATITSVTLDQTQFVYAPGVAHSVNVTVMAGSLTVPSGSYTVTIDGVTGNSATAAGTHTVRATARTDIANNFKGYAETTFAITERTVSIDFGGRTFRTFYDGNETFLLPDGITAYIVTGVNGNVVTVKQVSYVLQGIPVLLESTPGTTNVADPAESFTGNLLQYAATATPATDKHYVLYNNEFVRASGTINGKVYLDLTGYSGGARSLVIGDGTTAIEGIVSTEDDGDVKWYDMQGRRINKPTKSGVYIKDGKKVVVKTRY